jgi:hypothetical protein
MSETQEISQKLIDKVYKQVYEIIYPNDNVKMYRTLSIEDYLKYIRENEKKALKIFQDNGITEEHKPTDSDLSYVSPDRLRNILEETEQVLKNC